MKKRRLRESLVDIEFDEEHFANMYDADSHYYEDVFTDIVSYIDSNYGSLSELPEDFQEFVDTCMEEQNITGNENGSYTYSRDKAYDNIFCSDDDSFTLYCLLMRDIYGDNDEGLIMRTVIDNNFESMDITIRQELCYPIIEWIYNNVDFEEKEVDFDDEDYIEDYDEGFEESVRRHKARIRR